MVAKLHSRAKEKNQPRSIHAPCRLSLWQVCKILHFAQQLLKSPPMVLRIVMVMNHSSFRVLDRDLG